MMHSLSSQSPEILLWFLLIETALALRQVTERHLKGGSVSLTPGEIRTLDYVMRHQSTRQVVLAERMGIEPMTLSVYLDRLESFGLIERKKDPGDRRLKLVEPTDNAAKVVADLEPTLTEIYQAMAKGIDREDLVRITAGLTMIRANLAKCPDVTPTAAPIVAKVSAKRD
ncbi:hypothetical protein M673_19775 (plasmid) [Aureimonas sp. AU20]|uniref:MarR family winged helix-turn-helix transcriptional regulator n=2 Tax=Aureimonas sp. AU20 TaxID=1349819 RepID=UPI0007222663|nr:MarR family transcriptional regulator [Aureimonas sp. AU20]ALN74969.1 hypothetical protein M673_19775 [Aureimonas sp. AU20]